mmetsp:Transcript_91153/g.174858  ORF Transcript_91153/g.174858 Transcript_91153/m.174858 type:complete len:391 (+) Transcript_91153:57-1229(+)
MSRVSAPNADRASELGRGLMAEAERRRNLGHSRGISPAQDGASNGISGGVAKAAGRSLVGGGNNAYSAGQRSSSRGSNPVPHVSQAAARGMPSQAEQQPLASRGAPLARTRPEQNAPSAPRLLYRAPGYNAGRDPDSLSNLMGARDAPGEPGSFYHRLRSQLMEDPSEAAPAPVAGWGRGAQRPPRGHRAASDSANNRTRPTTDFDEEARKLWSRLNLDPNMSTGSPYNALDPVWRNPETGGTLYVGNEVAAKSIALLEKHKVSHVVNCTDSIPNYHERDTGPWPITYHRFDITSHYHRVRNDEEAVRFVQPMLSFVSQALGRGQSVMVHCLAGAHRAGTTGIICLMHFAKLNPREATQLAKECRPIIDPICEFPALLAKVDRGWKTMKR